MTLTAGDEHRYLISAPWGDQAQADTREDALCARRQLAQDARDHDIVPHARPEDIFIIDRGFPFPPIEAAA
jgi:hypothetical protein